MMPPTGPHTPPVVAIVESNTLAAIGLKHLLQSVVPVAQVELFTSFEDLEAARPERFFHFFIAAQVAFAHMAFFTTQLHRTIVLTDSVAENRQLERFHTLCINVPEPEMVRLLLQMVQHAHPHGHNLPQPESQNAKHILTPREIEVLQLLVKGLINKEIAEQLHIALTTVITHRKNIMEKLGAKSISSLTIHAVMNGYVAIEEI